jgi:hypothetical protein
MIYFEMYPIFAEIKVRPRTFGPLDITAEYITAVWRCSFLKSDQVEVEDAKESKFLSPLVEIFSREDISAVSRQNRKIQMANHFIQAY